MGSGKPRGQRRNRGRHRAGTDQSREHGGGIVTDHVASTPVDRLARPARPPAPDVLKFPAELKLLRQWVLWKYEFRGDTWTKIPYQPLKPAAKAKADDPATWGPFDLAW